MDDIPNLHEYKREALRKFCSSNPKKKYRTTVGLPMALGMYELLPLSYGIFDELGYKVILSEVSTKSTYEKGQFSIPSDTACYPAKLMHGHIESLMSRAPSTYSTPVSLTISTKKPETTTTTVL